VFIHIYNRERPHRGIGRATPFERWSASPKAINVGIALPQPHHDTTTEVDTRGCVLACSWIIHVGVDHKGRTARVMLDDTHAAVFIDGTLVRHLTLDHSRPYQASGLKRGARPHLP
jgi:hypothetical protein